MAIVENGVIGPIGSLDLIEGLRDQNALDAIARHERQRGLEEIKSTEGRKLIEHQKQPMPASFGVEIFRQPPADLVEDQPHQRLGPADIGGWHDQIEAWG